MGDIVYDFVAEWLSVGIEDGMPINVDPQHVSAVYWAALLGLQACPLSYICHNSRSFSLLLFWVDTFPSVNRCIAVITWVVLGLCARVGGRFLYTDHIHLFSEGNL